MGSVEVLARSGITVARLIRMDSASHAQRAHGRTSHALGLLMHVTSAQKARMALGLKDAALGVRWKRMLSTQPHIVFPVIMVNTALMLEFRRVKSAQRCVRTGPTRASTARQSSTWCSTSSGNTSAPTHTPTGTAYWVLLTFRD